MHWVANMSMSYSDDTDVSPSGVITVITTAAAAADNIYCQGYFGDIW